MKPLHQMAPDSLGVMRAVDERGVSFTYAHEWPSHEVFEAGLRHELGAGTAAANLRTVSKGSSRGAGPMKKQGRVRREGGAADAVAMCLHGQRKTSCARCGAAHCGCPGSPAHACAEAA